jgi:ketol-acid reductoisomerase
VKPLIEECYQSVVRGDEARIVIGANSDEGYRDRLNAELRTMASQELWEAGRVLRDFRPERQSGAGGGKG